MREKLEGARAEANIRGKAERTRFSTKTKARTEALDIAEGRAEAEAKEITQMSNSDIKAKSKVEAEGIDRIKAGSEAKGNVKA